MDFVKERHDIGIIRTDTTEVGLMLAQDKDGIPLYEEDFDEYLAAQTTEVAGYVGLPAEKEIRISQNTFHAGFGDEHFDTSDPKRYYESYNLDLRFKNMAFAGPLATAIALPVVPTIVNADMELTTGWTDGARSNTRAYGGSTYSWKVTGDTAYQALTWNAEYQNIIFTLTCWVWTATASDARISIHDGVSGTVSSDHTGGSGWEQLTTTRTLNGSASALTLNLISDSADAWFDDAVITFGVGVPTAFAVFNDELYIALDKVLTKLNATGDGFTLVYAFSTGITGLQVYSDDKLYISIGTSNSYWEMTTAEAFTENTDANSDMQFLAFVQGTADTMWGNDAGNKLRSTVDPKQTGTAWGNQTTVGDSINAITKLLAYQNLLYVMKEDKPWYLDSSGNTKVLTDITQYIASSTSGKAAMMHLERLYMNWGTEGLLEYDPNEAVFTWLSPSLFITNSSSFDGAVQGLAGDEEWLFAAIDNSTTLVEILAGRYETIDNRTRWVWHPISEITLAGCEVMFVSSIYQKRLWIASTDSSQSLYYIPLPQGYGNIVSDTNKSFENSGYVITPWYDGGFLDDTKAFIKLTLYMESTSSTDYFEAHYQIRGDTTWTEISPTDKFKTSPSTSAYIPADSGSVNPISTAIRFKFVLKRNASTATPILKGFDCRAMLYPTPRKVIKCVVRCADNMLDKTGQPLRQTSASIRTVLEEARDATWPFTFYDINGTARTVKLLPQKPFSRMVRNHKSNNIEEIFYLILQRVALA